MRCVKATDLHSGQVHLVQYLSWHTAHKHLATCLRNLQGHRESNNDNFNFVLRANFANWNISYHAWCLPSGSFPLTCSWLFHCFRSNEMQWQWFLHAVATYNQNTRKEIIYGLADYKGARFQHFYIKQGAVSIHHVCVIRLEEPNPTWKMLRCALEWLQIKNWMITLKWIILLKCSPSLNPKGLIAWCENILQVRVSLLYNDKEIRASWITFWTSKVFMLLRFNSLAKLLLIEFTLDNDLGYDHGTWDIVW